MFLLSAVTAVLKQTLTIRLCNKQKSKVLKMTRCHCTGTVHSATGEGNEEKVTLEACPEGNCGRCRSDVHWKTVSHMSTANRKDSVTDGRQLSSGVHQ